MTRSELSPIIVGVSGVFIGGTTLNVAWSLPFQVQNWHHGLIMIAASGAAIGYCVGAWAAEKARRERDEAASVTRYTQERYEALEGVVARSLRERRNDP